MDNVLAARCQMGTSLAFHIIFAAVGIALPLMMVIAEIIWLRTKDDVYLELARRWARGASILFAVGAVSGTILSFELGILWPKFMQFAGGIIGLPFALEGFAFFGEGIFLGIYLYGWKRVRPQIHIFAGIMVALCGALSAVFVITANAWMNVPRGFHIRDGRPVDIEPIVAMLNPSSAPQIVHMLIAAYVATAVLVAGIHAFMLLRSPNNKFHQAAFKICIVVVVIGSLAQLIAGDWIARRVAVIQPIKLAALEGQFETERGAPLRIGGIPDPVTEQTRFAIEIPKALSLLAIEDPNAVVTGLKSVPRDQRPPEPAVHLNFQVMVACGGYLAMISAWSLFLFARKRWDVFHNKWYLRSIMFAAPLGFIALETGWMVTELGRQPWVIAGVMRTKDAATPVPGLWIHYFLFTLVYIFLAIVVVRLIVKQVAQSPISSAEAGSNAPT